MFQIHPKFRLNTLAFQNSEELVGYLQNEFETDALFLTELFDSKTFITVQTSGSTGIPKKIEISKKALLHSAEATGAFFNLNPETKALHCISSQFIAGKMMWVRALHLGWHLTLVTPNANPLTRLTESFDFAAMVPLQAQNSFQELNRIKTLIIGGVALDSYWENQMRTLPTNIYQTYGMTETVTHIAVKKVGEKQYTCLPHVYISLDERGCLVIDAPNLANQKIITNDVVKITSINTFEWLGRYDFIINSGGIKIIPEEVEKKLQAFFPFTFIIAGIPDRQLGHKIVLIVESESFDYDFEVLYQQARLTKYERPKAAIFLPKFIRTDNGKINRIDTLININN